MKTTVVEVKKEINLLMNKEEAIWLKNILQNPLHTTYANESERDGKMRKLFWNEINNHFPKK